MSNQYDPTLSNFGIRATFAITRAQRCHKWIIRKCSRWRFWFHNAFKGNLYTLLDYWVNFVCCVTFNVDCLYVIFILNTYIDSSNESNNEEKRSCCLVWLCSTVYFSTSWVLFDTFVYFLASFSFINIFINHSVIAFPGSPQLVEQLVLELVITAGSYSYRCSCVCPR